MMRSAWHAALASALLAFLVFAASPAQARQDWPPIGAGGDATSAAECPEGQVLVGIYGRTGSWIDQIQAVCGVLYSDGSVGTIQRTGGVYGAFGGAETNKVCSDGSRVHSAVIRLTSDDRMVGHIQFNCVGRQGAYGGGFNFGSIANLERCITFIATTCSVEGAQTFQTCANEPAVGFTVRHGRHVNAIGLICDRRSGMARQPVAPTPGAVNPIRRTGRATTAGSAPASASSPPSTVQNTVAVKLAVDVYAAPGGEGQPTGQLGAGTQGVVLLAPCVDNWCHVRWPGREGWVYSGPDYNALGR